LVICRRTNTKPIELHILCRDRSSMLDQREAMLATLAERRGHTYFPDTAKDRAPALTVAECDEKQRLLLLAAKSKKENH